MLALLGETTVADVAACVVARQTINGIGGGRIAIALSIDMKIWLKI